MTTITPSIPATESIPAELRAVQQWVCWRIEQRGDRPTKVPIDPRTGKRAAVDNPSTWGSFEEATAAVERYGCAGVGFVFTADDDFVGIDLDDCIDRTTGEPLGDAKKIVSAFNSYCELSPSGDGLHVICQGTLPTDQTGRRCTVVWSDGCPGKIETYHRGRFFCTTGRRLPGTPMTIADRQPELDRLYAECFGDPTPQRDTLEIREDMELPAYLKGKPIVGVDKLRNYAPTIDNDDDLLSIAREAANGSKFSALFDRGEVSGYPSQSEADLALCSIFSFWTGNDEARIDRLFRRSGLMRDKWDERRGDRTYGQRTIESARCAEPYSGNGHHRRIGTGKSLSPTFSGPFDLRLTAIDARRTHTKIMLTFDLHRGDELTPIEISTTASSQRDAVATIADHLAAERGQIALPRADRTAIRRFVAQTMGKARKIFEDFAEQRQRAGGRTMIDICIAEGPRFAGLAFKNDDGSMWSELHQRDIQRMEFVHDVSKGLIEEVEKALDFPPELVGASPPVWMIERFLGAAWAEALRSLPREVDAKLGPDSAAAARFRQNLIDVFNAGAFWVGRDSGLTTLARVANESIKDLLEDGKSGLGEAKYCRVDARLFMRNGHIWIGIAFQFLAQVASQSRWAATITNVRSADELRALADRYGHTAEAAGDENRPADRHYVVLSADLSTEILVM